MRVVLVLALLVLVEPFFLRREGAEAEAEADSDPSAASSSSNENAFDSIFSFSSLQSPFFLKPVNSQTHSHPLLNTLIDFVIYIVR